MTDLANEVRKVELRADRHLGETQRDIFENLIREALRNPEREDDIREHSTIQIDGLDITRASAKCEMDILTVTVWHPHDEDTTMSVETVGNCEYNHGEEGASSLRKLSADMHDLATDLASVVVYMTDLERSDGSLQEQADGDFEFTAYGCHKEETAFELKVTIDPRIAALYENKQYEMGERLGIPVGPASSVTPH
jgi:hypothetical protein